MIYLDNAATTSIDARVLEAMLPYFTEFYGNPSSIHSMGRKSRSAIERARKTVASTLNCSPSEIFFTSGGTESNNMVIQGVINHLGVTRIITAKTEHHCVLDTIEHYKNKGIHVDYVSVDKEGFFDISQIENLLKTHANEKILVALMHANNEIGTLNDWKRIGSLAKEQSAYFLSDTVQTIAHYPIDLQDTPVDFITASAHKFHGPKGIGFVYISNEVSLPPLLIGGAQERNMRAGTESVAQIVGLAKALEIAYEELEMDRAKIQEIKSYFIHQLEQSFSEVSVNGPTNKDQSLYTVLNVTLPTEIDADMLLFNLDINGVCCSAGSACSSGAHSGSHVIHAIYNESRPSLRFSFSKHNTKQEVDQVIEQLKNILNK